MVRVFVYGTLKRGGALSLERAIADGAVYEGEAEVQGEIRECGFPYLLPHGATPVETALEAWVERQHETVPRLMPHVEQVQPWIDNEEIPLVVGEIWNVPPVVAAQLDMIEGVRRFENGKPDAVLSHYLPITITARIMCNRRIASRQFVCVQRVDRQMGVERFAPRSFG